MKRTRELPYHPQQHSNQGLGTPSRLNAHAAWPYGAIRRNLGENRLLGHRAFTLASLV